MTAAEVPEDPERVLTIIGLPFAPDGSGYHRIYLPFKHLAANSRHVTGVPAPGAKVPAPEPGDLDGVDVLVMQRPAFAQGCKHFAALAGHVARVYETDDDLLSAERAMLPEFAADPRAAESIRFCLRRAEMVTVSTPYLAEAYARYNRNITVLPNYVNADLLAVPRKRRDRVVLGWQGGSSHFIDMCSVQDPLREVLDAHPEVDTHWIGVDWDPLVRHQGRFTPWSADVWDYYNATDFDIAIAPLADIPWNRSKCIDSSMRICTDRGVVEAGSLHPGMKVWRDGWRKIEAAVRDTPRPGVLITTEGGYQLRLTPEHRMMVNGEWTQAGHIVPGDRMAMEPEWVGVRDPVRVPWPADSRMGRSGAATTADPRAFLTAPDGPRLDITPRWGRFLGAFAGDGSVGQSTMLQISCDGQDQDWIDMLMDDLRAFGFNPRTENVRKFDGTSVLRRRGVRVASAHLLRVLESLGVTRPRPNGRPIRVPCVPEVIWNSPREVIAEFLAAYFETDGHCTGNGVSAVSKDEKLIRDVQRLLLLFGITSVVKSRVHSAQNGHTGDYWHVTLRRAEADVFAKEIGFRSERKIGRLARITGKPHSGAYRPMTWTREVVSAEPCFVTPIDIQVEGSVFIAAGFVSHNSYLKALDAAARGIPVVASDIEPYREFVRDGETGYLVRTPEQWTARLTELICDEAAREEMGAKAKALAARYTIQEHWPEFEAAYVAAAEGR